MSTVDKLASVNLREEYNKTEIRSIIANLEADLVGLVLVGLVILVALVEIVETVEIN